MSDEWVKSKLESIDSKIDKLDSRIDNIDVTLGKQSVVLDEHIRRTEIAEANIEILKKELKPVQNTLIMFEGVLKFIGGVATLISVTYGLLKLIETLISFFHQGIQ